MKKKCVFIIPYFGQFKNYFSLFLESCAYNTDFDWIIFTDNEDSFDYPRNVKKIQMTFEKIKKIIQEKFDFKISLDAPYKLCDYKPAYGYIFEKMIMEYDYWGYCDCDLVFGSMNNFLSSVLDAGYDKVFAGGHCTIYRNTCENNRRFMSVSSQYGKLYKQAYTSKRIFAFDEMCYGQMFTHCFWNKQLVCGRRILHSIYPRSRICSGVNISMKKAILG